MDPLSWIFQKIDDFALARKDRRALGHLHKAMKSLAVVSNKKLWLAENLRVVSEYTEGERFNDEWRWARALCRSDRGNWCLVSCDEFGKIEVAELSESQANQYLGRKAIAEGVEIA